MRGRSQQQAAAGWWGRGVDGSGVSARLMPQSSRRLALPPISAVTRGSGRSRAPAGGVPIELLLLALLPAAALPAAPLRLPRPCPDEDRDVQGMAAAPPCAGHSSSIEILSQVGRLWKYREKFPKLQIFFESFGISRAFL